MQRASCNIAIEPSTALPFLRTITVYLLVLLHQMYKYILNDLRVSYYTYIMIGARDPGRRPSLPPNTGTPCVQILFSGRGAEEETRDAALGHEISEGGIVARRSRGETASKCYNHNCIRLLLRGGVEI